MMGRNTLLEVYGPEEVAEMSMAKAGVKKLIFTHRLLADGGGEMVARVPPPVPAGAPRAYRARSPWKEDSAQPPLHLAAGRPHAFRLEPFQVLTLEMSAE
jgi:hypothetical protein